MTQYTLATQHFMNETKEDARGKLYKLGVKTSYDDNRMIFTASQSFKAQLANIYTQECNGLILSKVDWTPLMVPPRSLRTNIVTDIANTFLHQGLYHVYLANDGTCFNMYWFENRWVISTAKGYEMNNISWEDKTYQTLITECLEQINMTWEQFTNTLDAKYCYSFIFNHKSFHRFYEGIEEPSHKLWFIQMVNLDKDDKLYLWASDVSPFEKIKSQSTCHVPNNIKELYTKSNNALSDFLNKKNVCYGFILRSVNYESTKSHSDLFIESSLMRNIRHIWYDNRLIKTANENAYNKLQLTLVNAYLDRDLYEMFTLLFGQFNNELSTVSDRVNMVINEMIQPSSDDAVIVSTANILLDKFKNEKKYDISTKNADQKRRIFNEYTINKVNLDIIMRLF
jgi:hypothetical protein